jgi:hypothetical protein
MAMAGTRTPLAIVPNEDQTEVGVAVGGSLPPEGQDMGATSSTGKSARAGEAQVAQEPARNGVGPRGRLCSNKQKRQPRPQCAMRELIKRRGGPLVPSRI